MDTTSPRIGVLGGTFDPIHVGHLAAASEVHAALTLDRVLVVPAAEQPFKAGREVATGDNRLAMARLAVKGDARLEVSDVDIARGAPTYTIDTLTELRRAHSRRYLVFRHRRRRAFAARRVARRGTPEGPRDVHRGDATGLRGARAPARHPVG